jgi:hypothetical protein
MKKYAAFLMAGLMLGACACSSGPEKVVNDIKKDYVVTDASTKVQAQWINSPQKWAKGSSDYKKDAKTYSFYVGKDLAVTDRSACDNADANVKSDIAKEVATLIESKIVKAKTENTVSTTATIESEQAQHNISTIAENAIAVLHGVKEVEEYWEKRDYSKSKSDGPKSMYTCWVLVKVSNEMIETMIKKAGEKRKEMEDPSTKSLAEKALTDLNQLSQNYIDSRAELN